MHRLPTATAISCSVMLSLAPYSVLADVHVHLQTEKEGPLEIQLSRAKDSATGAVLGGLIGAAIESGVRSGQDQSKEDELLPELTVKDCGTALYEAFDGKLSKRDGYRFSRSNAAAERPVATSRDEGRQLVLHLKIDRCGFKLLDSSSGELGSFIEARYRIREANAKETNEPYDRLFMSGRKRSTWEELIEDPAVADQELIGVLRRAGSRIANKIIYQK